MCSRHVCLPAARDFEPELIIISAGFDSAAGDPLGGYSISPSGVGFSIFFKYDYDYDYDVPTLYHETHD